MCGISECVWYESVSVCGMSECECVCVCVAWVSVCVRVCVAESVCAMGECVWRVGRECVCVCVCE